MTDTPWWHQGDTASDGGGGADALGTAATEAARLFEVLRDRLVTDPNTMRAGMKMMEAFTLLRGSGGHPVQPGDAPECAYCPVCQAIAHARTVNPETVERLTAAAMEFAEAVRQVVTPDADAESGVRHVPLDDDELSGNLDTTVPRADGDDEFLGWPGDDE